MTRQSDIYETLRIADDSAIAAYNWALTARNTSDDERRSFCLERSVLSALAADYLYDLVLPYTSHHTATPFTW